MSENTNISSKTNLAVFQFENFDVRIEDRNGEPWFVANDVGKILELSRSSVRDIIAKLKDNQKGVVSIDTLGGPQKTTIISEQGLYKMLMQSRKPNAEKFQDWIAEEVVPSIRKTGSYTTKPLSQLEILQQSLEILVTQQKQLDAHESKFQAIDDKLEELDTKQSIEKEFNEKIKANTEAAKEMPLRANLNLILRKYVQKNDASYSNCWNDLYVEFKYRYSIDVKRRAANNGKSKLDIVDDLGMMSDLYSLAVELFLE